jgi:hypothetical protein
MHEGRQIGYSIVCPHCEEDIDVPIAEFLDDNIHWNVPPQNAAVTAGGWYFAWGSHNDPTSIHLRQPIAVPRSDHAPGDDAVIICTSREWGTKDATGHADIVNSGCGCAYRVVKGELIEVA